MVYLIDCDDPQTATSSPAIRGSWDVQTTTARLTHSPRAAVLAQAVLCACVIHEASVESRIEQRCMVAELVWVILTNKYPAIIQGHAAKLPFSDN